MTAIRSRHYLDGARGEPCRLRIPGVCRDERDTVVACHVRDRHTGRSIKASDLSVIDGCYSCHEVFDSRAKMPSGLWITPDEWWFYALRGLQETIERRVEQGLLIVRQDVEKPFAERAAKARKPKADRAKIQSPGFSKQSRPMQNRPFEKRRKP